MDEARTKTDRQLAQVERRLHKIYSDAQKETEREWKAYMRQADKKTKVLQREYERAVRKGDTQEIERTKAELDRMKRQETFYSARYQAMLNYTTDRLAMTNQMAVAYVNNQIPSIYMMNYNQIGTDAHEVGVSFELVDENAVARLVTNRVPVKRVDVPKDKRWNEKQINSQVTQGILRGESMDKIAKRLTPIMDNNEAAAMRNARTMVTAAENGGRLDGMKYLEQNGVVMMKVWMATPDDRTRESHIDVDGEEQKLDDYFSNGCQFPGDGDGPAEEVWNCRCSMRSHIIGIKKSDGSIKAVDYEGASAQHDAEMSEEISRRMFEKTEKDNKKVEKEQKKAEEYQRPEEKTLPRPDYMNRLENYGIDYIPVEYLDRELTKEEIIEKLAGGDRTAGSCASLCFAYAGNNAGYDVLDFRGGDSTDFFCRDRNIIDVMKGAGANVQEVWSKNDVKACMDMLKTIEPGKEYILCSGRHAAVVRCIDENDPYVGRRYEFLEMQHPVESKNGWQNLDRERLVNRFGCSQRASMTHDTYMIGVDEMESSNVFRETLGYINTPEDKQKKGESGRTR